MPVVLCAFDWCEIRAADHLRVRELLAKAAGTTPERVAVHSLHQHNAPIADREVTKIMEPHQIAVTDIEWTERAFQGVAQSIAAAIPHAQPLTHLTVGEGKVEQVASNRRILGDNGKIAKMRLSSTKDPVLRELPDGQIDSMLKTICFWNGETKLASLHYYATHPMSFYGDGMVTHDFVGIARERRTKDEGVPHIYFTGCGGNIAAGKYNDGTKESRVRLGEQIYAAMVASEKQMKRAELNRSEWYATPVVVTPVFEFRHDSHTQVYESTRPLASRTLAAACRDLSLRNSTAVVRPVDATSASA